MRMHITMPTLHAEKLLFERSARKRSLERYAQPKMTRTLIFILTICYSLTAKADLPGPAYQYDRYSENGKYYFKSIPFYNYDLTNFGKTII